MTGSRSAVDEFLQHGGAVVTPVEVIVIGLCRRDPVVGELDELRCGRVAAGLFEDEAHAPVALGISQDFIAVDFVVAFNRFAIPTEGDHVAFNGDALDIGLVAGVVVGLVFRGGHAAGLGLVLHDRVERAVLKIGMDRLPVAGPVGKGAIRDLAVLEIALGDLRVAMIVGMRFVAMSVIVVMAFMVMFALVDHAAAAGNGDIVGHAADVDGAEFREAILDDAADEAGIRVAHHDFIAGHGDARTRIVPVAVHRIRLGDPGAFRKAAVQNVDLVQAAILGQDIAETGIGRIEREVDAAEGEFDVTEMRLIGRVDDDETIGAVIAENTCMLFAPSRVLVVWSLGRSSG